MSKLDLTSNVFGRLTVLSEGPKKGYHRYWLCNCICGNTKTVGQSNLRDGKSTSCGCYATELAGDTYKSKFQTHGDHGSRLYGIHKGMLNRCNKTWDSNYSRYGALGISVCAAWYSYQEFKNWALINGYTETLTLDRINGALNYCPENCRWETYQTQTRNRRKQSKPASSRYIGVSREKRSTKWLASLSINKVTHRIGYFDTEEEAAKARDSYIQQEELLNFKLNF